jgi:hypothetical protein
MFQVVVQIKMGLHFDICLGEAVLKVVMTRKNAFGRANEAQQCGALRTWHGKAYLFFQLSVIRYQLSVINMISNMCNANLCL